MIAWQNALICAGFLYFLGLACSVERNLYVKASAVSKASSAEMIVRAGVACTIFPSFKGIVDTRFVAMIKRGKAPRLGQWSLPGGRIEWGETLAEGAKREVMEEISLPAASITVQPLQPGGIYSFSTTDAIHINENFHYIVAHVLAFVDCDDSATPIQLRAGDDAMDATWVRFNDDDIGGKLPTLSSLKPSLQVISVIKLAQLLVKNRMIPGQELT